MRCSAACHVDHVDHNERALLPLFVGSVGSCHKYVHTSLKRRKSPCFLTRYVDLYNTMGNTQSQNPSSSSIQRLPRKIAAKLPAVPTRRDRPKDSGYRSGSASSSGTALKGARLTDQTSATVASTGSGGGEQGSTPRPETAPATAERHSDAPAPPTEAVCPK